MAGEEETIRILDLPANKADIAELVAEIRKLDEAAKSVSGINIFGKTGNATEARQQQQQMAAGMQQIAELQQKLIDLENQLAAVKAKGGGAGKAKTDEEIRAQVELTEAKRKQLAAIKDQVRYDQAEIDSIVRKRIELKQLQAQYDSLSATARSADTGKGLLTQIQEMDAGLKNLEGSTGRFQRNVGNYSGALKALEEEFRKVTSAMSQMETRAKGVQNFGARTIVQGFAANQHQNQGPGSMATGVPVSILNEDAQAYAKLSEQAGWLNTIIQKQEGGFSSVTMQIRASERALISMREAGLEDTEAFAALRTETTAAARDMKEFQRQQKLLESEVPALKALTLAAKGLGGAYAIGSGMANLFADSNEKVQEKIGKMMAVMMILQGLEEAWVLVNQAGAAAMAVKTTAMGAATFATDLYAAAIGEATAAMTALDAVMIASGIGAIVVALGGLIYLLSKATVDTTQLYEAQGKLNEYYKSYYETLIKSNESLGQELEKQDEIGKRQQEILAINVRSVKDQENLNALKVKNAEADRKRAADEMQDFKTRVDNVDDLQGQYDEQIRRVSRLKDLSKDYQAQIADAESKGKGHSVLDEQLKNNEALVKSFQSEADATKTKLDRYNELTKSQEGSEQALKVLAAEDDKFSHELYERKIKALTEISNLLRQQSADYLAIQTRSAGTQDFQLSALQAEKSLREQIITSSRDQELRAENLTADERQLIREKANKSLIDLDSEFIGREANIRYNARQQDISDENFTNAELIKLREQFYQRQEQLAQTNFANRKAAEETDRDQRLKTLLEEHTKRNPAGQNNDELRKYNEQKLTIETESNNKILAAERELTRKQIALAQQKENELKATNPSTAEGKQKQLKDIQDLEQQKNALTAKYENLELQMAQHTASQQSLIDKDKLDRKKAMADAEIELGKQVAATTQAFVDGAYEHQLQIIDRQIRKNNELKETETARIANSTLSETQRAAALTRLAMETDQRNQALERKKRQVQIEQAEFDRDKGVFDVIANTAVAVSAAVKLSPLTFGLPWSAFAAAMGAAQVAAILARPIPKFEQGTDFSPEGLAMVHPGEMRIDPSGKISMTPDAPAYTYLDRGTKIIPRHNPDAMNAMLLANILSDARPLEDNRIYYEFRSMKEAIMRVGRDQVAAIKKQKPPETHIHVDSNFLTYIKTCL